MRDGFVSKYKRNFYMQQLTALGVTKVEGKALQQLSDRELKSVLSV